MIWRVAPGDEEEGGVKDQAPAPALGGAWQVPPARIGFEGEYSDLKLRKGFGAGEQNSES